MVDGAWKSGSGISSESGEKAMSVEDIIYEVNAGVAQIILNKPDKLNALSWGTLAEIETAMQEANRDDAVRCVLFTGAGRGFSSGTDLTDGAEEDQQRPFQGDECAALLGGLRPVAFLRFVCDQRSERSNRTVFYF